MPSRRRSRSRKSSRKKRRSRRGGAESAEAYCVKCKAHRKMLDVQRTTTKKGQPMLRGKCEKCGTKMAKFIPKNK